MFFFVSASALVGGVLFIVCVLLRIVCFDVLCVLCVVC